MKLIPKPLHGSEEWLRLRHRDSEGKCTFGASEAAALMGCSPYTSRGDLFAAKMGAPIVSKETEAFRRGNLLEPVLIAEASRMLGVHIETPEMMYRKGRFTATLDGVDDELSPAVVVEAKTTTRYRVNDQEDLPQEWLWQGWAQSFVTGAKVVFIVFDQDQRFRLIDLPENAGAIEWLEEEAVRFGEAVDNGEVPSDELMNELNYEQIGRIWRATPSTIELPVEAVDLLADYEACSQLVDEYSKQLDECKNRLARLLLTNEIGTLDGQQVVTWKEQAGRSSFDAKQFAIDNPELHAQYVKQGAPFRVMRVNRKRGK